MGWAAAASVRAGAGAVHFHVRGADLEQSLAAEDVARCVSAVRLAIPKRYDFSLPDTVMNGGLRPLRNPISAWDF